MEEEEPTAVVAPVNGWNELMEKEEEMEPTDVLAPINGRNELKRLSDATKQDDDGESSTQCTLCGADYSHESLRWLLNQNPVQLKSPSNNRQPSSPFLRRHPPRSNDPLQVESTAAVLKLGITCGGCVAKISQIVSITEGVKEIVIDKRKETVTFKATLEVKKLSETLRRRPVMGLPGRQAAEYLQSQTDQYAGSEPQQEMEKTQNDNTVRCDEDTSMHLGSEDGHQQDSSSLRLRGTKSDAKEWAWVVMSLLFEGLSAIFDQLGYTLTGMVMAYVALLLFVVELTLKARRERLTWAVGTSLLPCFRRCSAHNNSRNVTFLVSVVELFGLASALWQCFYSTMQYKYTRWPSHNPIKSCLLPFLFVLCVFVSKFIRCSHYRRRCKIKAPCCNEIYDCRHCHNEAKNGLESNTVDTHDLPRHEITKVICSLCNTEQDVQQKCTNCGVCMGKYFCAKCNLFDDDVSKNQFHCNGCGICRIGEKEKYYHCDKCGCCYSKWLKDAHHCVERAMHQNCPVCFEYLFDSMKDIAVLGCGRTIHLACLKEMEQHYRYSCPICSKSICDMSRVWERLDEEIAVTPPPVYSKMVWILCNDCGASSHVQFHVVALKCISCKSYNTRQTRGGPSTSCSSRIARKVR